MFTFLTFVSFLFLFFFNPICWHCPPIKHQITMGRVDNFSLLQTKLRHENLWNPSLPLYFSFISSWSSTHEQMKALDWIDLLHLKVITLFLGNFLEMFHVSFVYHRSNTLYRLVIMSMPKLCLCSNASCDNRRIEICLPL